MFIMLYSCKEGYSKLKKSILLIQNFFDVVSFVKSTHTFPYF
uniref:Uncharacterized protein n=1 Tax=Bacteriophage sp. TaxID=38018 RepID=A0A8D9UHP1_9VIRU|nr:MAG TPA: hypothetical protein [Bacteriophage sp.]